MTETKVLIVVFDALRPEFVRPDVMPNLCAFATAGVRYENYRSTFPTETRVNQTAVLTGCYPRKHGIVANRFPILAMDPARVVNTGDDAQIANAFATVPGGLLAMPTLGERLHAAGLTYASLSAGTPGGGRLINHMAEAHGTFRLAMRAPDAAQPAGVVDEIVAEIGPMPDYTLPAIEWIRWAVDAYLEFVVPQVDPDVMLLWLCEPDESFHYLGIGSPGSLETLRNADAQFGRILEDRAAAIADGSLHVIAMSDHGQISLSGGPLGLVSRLTDAGFAATSSVGSAAEFTVVAGNAGGIWMRQPDEARLGELVEWLMAQEWCGAMFTRRGTAGTLRNSEVMVDHARAPDICLNMGHDDSVNDWIVAGTSVHDAPYPTGGGCHGGLSAHELQNFLALGGKRLRAAARIDAPAANTDILPSILRLLGLPGDDAIDGRCLDEAFADGRETALGDRREHVLTAPNGQTRLSVTDLGRHRYLNRAWAETH